MIRTATRNTILAFTASIMAAASIHGQVLDPAFVALGYQLHVIGPITGLPTPYGGLTIKASEPDVLYIAGASFTTNGVIHTVPLTRDPNTGQITGFAGSSSLFALAPNVDGTVTFAENGTLIYTRFPTNALGQILPDNTTLNTSLTNSGVPPSPGSMAFVPAGMPGAGNLIIASYTENRIMHVPHSFDVQGFLQPGWTNQPLYFPSCNGPEGIAYVLPGSPGFTVPRVIMTCYDGGYLRIFDVDASGLPISDGYTNFVNLASNPSGAAFDPVTGDLLFTTNGNPSRLVRVSGFSLTTAVNETAEAPAFELFPNPSDGLVRIRLNTPSVDARLEVFDGLGALVHAAHMGGAVEHVIDLRHEGPGLYMLRVGSGQGTTVQRLVME